MYIMHDFPKVMFELIKVEATKSWGLGEGMAIFVPRDPQEGVKDFSS